MAEVRQAAPQHERMATISELIDADGFVRIDALAEALGVSEMTIRRDLDELEAQGVVRRVRGGALPVGPETFAERHRHNAKPKARIAEKLLALLPATGTVALDASSTVHRLAATVEGAQDLVVVTNGLDTFDVLAGRPGVQPMLTGGVAEVRTGSLVGPLAVRAVEDFLFDLCITSAAGLDASLGASETSVEEAEVKRQMAQRSARTVLAVDNTKLGARAQAAALSLDAIDLLVTDLDPQDGQLDVFRGRVEIL